MLKLYLMCMALQSGVAAITPYVQIVLRNKGYSHSLIGWVIAVGQLASIVFPLVIASFSDKTGNTKRYIQVSALFTLLASIPFALSGNILFTFIAYFICSGFFWTINPLCDGFVSSLMNGDASRYSKIRAAGTMTYVVTLVGFALLGYPREDNNFTILVVTILASLWMMQSAQMLPKNEGRIKSNESDKKLFDFKWFSLKVYIFLFIVLLTRAAQAVPDKLLSAYMTEELNLGNYFTVFYAFGALCEFFALIYCGKKIREKKVSAHFLLSLSCIGMLVRFSIYYLTTNTIWFVVAQSMHALTFAALHVSVISFISDNVEESHIGLATSLYWSVATNLPQMLASLLGGYIIQYMGYKSLFLIYMIFPIVALALCIIFKRLLLDRSKSNA